MLFLQQRNIGCVNGPIWWGSLELKRSALWTTWATGSVVDAGADSTTPLPWVEVAKHDHDARVMPRIVFAFFEVLALFTQDAILPPGVFWESEGHISGFLL